MADIYKLIAAVASFIIGYFASILVDQFTQSSVGLVELLPTDLQGLIWIFAIIIWALALLIVPIGLTIWGLQDTQPDERPSQVFGIATGGLWCLFALLLTYYAWYWVPIMADFITQTILLAFFWTGLILIWTTNVLIIPAYFIYQARQQ